MLVPGGCVQMWNSVFWPCMTSTRCVDKSVDDVSFLAGVITGMQQLLPGLPLKPQVRETHVRRVPCLVPFASFTLGVPEAGSVSTPTPSHWPHITHTPTPSHPGSGRDVWELNC